MAKWQVVLGFCVLLGLSMALSSSEALKSRAAGLVLHMRDEPVSGGAIYLVVSCAITVSGIPFSLHDLGVATVYPFRVAMAMIFVRNLPCTHGCAPCNAV